MKHLARSRGVSLLEALVALAVMAIGAVAVVGLQATLRLNGDVAKQRSEAVRLAQEVLEQGRGFTTFTATAGVADWVDIVSATDTLTPAASNTTFTRTVTVVPSGGATDDPLSKTVHVQVTWTDRTNQTQTVDLNSIVAGVDPSLGGTLSLELDTSPIHQAGGRNPAIPRGAVDQHDGTSRFTPPGGSTSTWVFNNTTGLVVQLCPPLGLCSDIKGMLLSGFIRFATGTVQPTGADAENPTSTVLPTLEVTVVQESPYNTTVNCAEAYGSTDIAYFCLVRVDLLDTVWTGSARITGISLAGLVSDFDPATYKVCRYTTVRDNTKVVPTDMTNVQGPLRYVNVAASLIDQNFLVIKAGQSSVAFTCPDDDSSTSLVNGATWYHQPAS